MGNLSYFLMNPRSRWRRTIAATGLVFALVAAASASAGEWKFEPGANPNGPGEKVDVLCDGQRIGRFVYGAGQFKPYRHVFGEEGELLTNGGLDPQGKASGLFPHHRGIFIGWKISSELGTNDLWHMTKGCRMEVEKITKTNVVPKTGSATLEATVLWHAASKDETGSDRLLTETRTLLFSRLKPKQTVIDATFTLNPAREISLIGDLQHSGVHFRAANEVAAHTNQTAYLFEPEKKVKGGDLKWVQLLFPIGQLWYTALEINAPSNPVEELSMRDYGRFGYFFKKKLKKSEPLILRYRFVIEEVSAPAENSKRSAEQSALAERDCRALFDSFAQAQK